MRSECSLLVAAVATHLPPDEAIEIVHVIIELGAQAVQSCCETGQVYRTGMLQHLQARAKSS